ncbi:hypothetical protein WR25_10116 [Diploscapter pachys]|uniref:PSP proline-rich domain-containing protein n=1 Tax=Diploscapter pachys TaxID=2018661 RepID=A0A2A2LEC3_9BILA|nr:hypothetical protein WR25_10116 [Diploscapter pachys]
MKRGAPSNEQVVDLTDENNDEENGDSTSSSKKRRKISPSREKLVRETPASDAITVDDKDLFVFDHNTDDVIIDEPPVNTQSSSLDDGELFDETMEPDEDVTNKELAWTRNLSMSMGLLTDVDHLPQPESSQSKSSRQKRSCFNCGGDHSLHQCSEPKNFQKIRENQQAFRDKFQNNQRPDVGRYHDKSDEKFRPGKLSPALREALSLGPDDIPDWIYKMRRLGFINGYPPAYLKRAIVKDDSEGLLNFHTDDARLEMNGNGSEAGRESPPPLLDAKKIIFYMGFNNTYPRLRDREREKFRVPPFDEYCRFLQDKVNADHEEKQKEKRKQKKKKEKQTKFENDEDEVQILNPPPPPPEIITLDTEDPASPDHVAEEKDDEESSSNPISIPLEMEDGPSKIIPKGLPTSTHVGTPVFTRHHQDGSIITSDTPLVDNFRDGIQPFVYLDEEESNPHKGHFNKIRNIIKELRK